MRRIASPLGELELVADATALLAVRLPGEPAPSGHGGHGQAASGDAPEQGDDDSGSGAYGADRILRAAAGQLDAYFAGSLTRFDLPLRLNGTPFQRRVWQTLLDIPYAATLSYADVAVRAGRPGAARAVGRAVGQNPLAIIVPCHRVVGSDGSLTGYGGGLPAKDSLLRLEQRWGTLRTGTAAS